MTRFAKSRFWAFPLLLVLAGCASLPRAGFSSDDVASVASQPDPDLMLVDLTEPVVDAMVGWPSASLRGRFADDRSPISQHIGVGDSIQITIWEAASGGLFSATLVDRNAPGSRSAVIPEQMVGQDGSVTVPYAGRIPVAGKSPSEVEKIIVSRLTGKAIEPQALVTLSKNVSSTATVTGEVVNGARVPLSARGDRILDVIASAGGVRSPVHESFITLTRGAHSVRVPMRALLTDPRENIFVRPNDILTVEREPQTFTAAGAAGRNAVVPFDANGITLEEAIGKAGGLLDERANPDGVYILRFEPRNLISSVTPLPDRLASRPMVPVVYHLNMRDPRSVFVARRFAVRNKDVLFITNAPVTDLYKFMQIFNTLVTPAATGAAVAIR